jgi:acyl-CoA thioester hydrolase
MGVAYHANYFVWFEVARTDLLRYAGWTYREMEGEGFWLPVIEARCSYQKPARYDDELDVHTRAVLLSPVRLKFEYEICRSADQAEVAGGETIHASIDASGTPRRLPDRVRELLKL